jgi:hypothetical protein
MSQAAVAAAETFGDGIVIRFDGLDTDRHEIDMGYFSEAIGGLYRIIGVTGNFAATGRLVLHRDAFSLKVFLRPPEAHCFEVITWLKWINENPLITTVAGGLVVTLVSYVFSKAAGDREEMRQLRGALDVAIRELGTRDQSVIDKLLSTIDRMAENLRPAVKRSVAPIGETAATMTVSDLAQTRRSVYGAAEKAAILSDADVEVGPESNYRIRISEMDMKTGACKVSLEAEPAERVSARITDPVFTVPNNTYVLAMAAQSLLTVRAKPLSRGGEFEMLYISDVSGT